MAGARRLAQANPQDFEAWAVTRIPGLAPNEIKVGDGGIDGRGRMQAKPSDYNSPLVLAQVKGGRPTIDQVRAFMAAMERDNAAMGIFVKRWIRWGRTRIPASRCRGGIRRRRPAVHLLRNRRQRPDNQIPQAPRATPGSQLW